MPDLGVSVVDLAVIALAMGFGALAKSITGMGLPLIGVPVMASVLGVERAVVVMALPVLVTNTWLLWEHRRFRARAPHLPTMVLLGGVGTIAGTTTLVRADPAWIAAALAAVLFGYLGLRLARPALRFPLRVARWASPGVGLVGGALQGATGMSSPVLAPYLHALGLPQRVFVVSITAMFQVFALIQLVTFAVLGSYTLERVVESVLSLVPILLVFPLGIRLARRVDARRFEWLVLGLLAATGVKLLVDALGGRL